MMSTKLEKIIEYLTKQESLWYEISEYYSCKRIFLFFSTLKDSIQPQS